MSQIYKAVASGSLPPDVPLQFTTNDGVATPVANNLNVFGTDSSDDNLSGVETTGTGDTVRVVLTNRLTGNAVSTAGSNADLITFNLGASAAVYRFEFEIAGRSTAGANVGEGVGYSLDASARTDGATATIISTPYQDADEDTNLSTSTINFIASGNTVILRANGAATDTISYRALGEYIVV